MCPRTSGRVLERLIFVDGDALWAVVDVGNGVEASVRLVRPDYRRWSAWWEMGAREQDFVSPSSSALEKEIVGNFLLLMPHSHIFIHLQALNT